MKLDDNGFDKFRKFGKAKRQTSISTRMRTILQKIDTTAKMADVSPEIADYHKRIEFNVFWGEDGVTTTSVKSGTMAASPASTNGRTVAAATAAAAATTIEAKQGA